MTELTPFRAARPAMIVGRAQDGGPAPLGLSEPFALNGGDRLREDGIAFDLMHEHQPGFLGWVAGSCRALIAARRPWFRGSPIVVTGPRGSGRTHAARRLAHVAGVPHVILDLGDPMIASSIASSDRVSESLWASPCTVAMAARRCANPVVTVIGMDKAGDDVTSGLASMIDPAIGRAWSEDQLRTMVDFGEVTWVVQCDNTMRIPATLQGRATHIRFNAFPAGIEHTGALTILLEVLDDLGLDASDPAFDWPRISRAVGRHHRGANDLYARMAQIAANIAGNRPSPREDEDVPF